MNDRIKSDLIIDPNRITIPIADAIIACVDTLRKETSATDGLVVALDRRTGEFRITSFPSDMNRTIEMLEKALRRIKDNAGGG